jgi:Transposase DDE domain
MGKKVRNADHVRRKNVPGPDNEVVKARLERLLSRAVYSQIAYFQSLGLRARILSLPLMVAALLTLLWQQIPSVSELTRVLNRDGALWFGPVQVSQAAVSKRLQSLPYEVMRQVFMALLPVLQERWQARQRPLPESLVAARQHFEHVYAVDGSSLEALFRKLAVLEDAPRGQLGGKICTVVDLAMRLPEQIFFRAEALAHDTTFLPDILSLIHAGTLWVVDRGFYDFAFFGDVIERGGHFITRLKANAVFQVQTVLTHTNTLHDRVIMLGGNTPCRYPLRLIEVRLKNTWYRYVTSLLDPTLLPPLVVVDLYRRRWRLEEAFLIVKRLLNLAYLWTGSLNGILLQVWATWLFFAVLVDLGDAVAEQLMRPFDDISLEMVFRGLYHFHRAFSKGTATDPILYLADPVNHDLGILKRLRPGRPSRISLPLDA